MFIGSRQQDLQSVPTYSLHYGHLIHPHTGAMIDEAIVSVMRTPHSYTREDVIEMNCHGGMTPLRNVLDLVLSCGARLAAPGEFTKRAFLNGRIDLAQAESVIDIIRAKTDAGLQLAVQQLQGKLSEHLHAIRRDLKHLLAEIEAAIDFSDDDIDIISHDRILETLNQNLSHVEQLLVTAQEGKIVRDGLSVAIIGKPNAGKSSLLNLLLQEERAIVTAVPGTTRDTIEEYLNLDGIPVRLIDTAGIRQTDDHVEAIGVARSREKIQQADMILCLFDASAAWSPEDDELCHIIAGKTAIALLNKIDLPPVLAQEDVRSRLPKPTPIFPVSVKKNIGLEEVKQAILADVINMPIESVTVTNLRHKQALIHAQEHLLHAQNSTAARLSLEFIALDLRESLDYIGEITGETTKEDILDEIFATFCIGK